MSGLGDRGARRLETVRHNHEKILPFVRMRDRGSFVSGGTASLSDKDLGGSDIC